MDEIIVNGYVYPSVQPEVLEAWLPNLSLIPPSLDGKKAYTRAAGINAVANVPILVVNLS